VIGAGLAGLAIARRLQAGGATVRVLEARNRVGGRMSSLGARWIHSQFVSFRRLCAELGLDVVDAPEGSFVYQGG
jgi:monoamine oxidase